MSKAYTAQEMREAALLAETVEVPDEFYGHEMDKIAAMLRQAAADLEREKREKAYEYSLKTKSGHLIGIIVSSEGDARHRMISGDRIVRREVGEWEEV